MEVPAHLPDLYHPTVEGPQVQGQTRHQGKVQNITIKEIAEKMYVYLSLYGMFVCSLISKLTQGRLAPFKDKVVA